MFNEIQPTVFTLLVFACCVIIFPIHCELSLKSKVFKNLLSKRVSSPLLNTKSACYKTGSKPVIINPFPGNLLRAISYADPNFASKRRLHFWRSGYSMS